MILGLLLACEESAGTVQFTGLVQDAPANLGELVPEATVTAQNRTGEVVGTDTTESDGAFSVAVGAGASFFINVSAEGYVDTAFSGLAGMADFPADTGYPWLAPDAWLAEAEAPYVDCATAGADGTLVLGQAVVLVAEVADASSWPAMAGVTIEVLGSDGGTYPGCYLDDDGVFDPSATGTGATGDFAVFGVPPGGTNVKATAERGNGELGTDVFEFISPEGGLIPIFPTAIAM